jgi:predicted ATPase
MDAQPPAIRTPDQRLRIFVSSTLKELADERKAARAAIERLHLAPVMFELGARPHPPRDLYRAYLAQSDVFVGLYWERYGWVAPGEEVSGLADEYLLASPSLPKLIYIKEPATREPRLVELLDKIRTDDTASFKYFSGAAELAEYLEADLATLLAERFTLAQIGTASAGNDAAPTRAALPAPLTELVGRSTELAAVESLVRDPAVRLVTLVGSGGIGKSRLAIAAASNVSADFPAGVCFVDLAPVHDETAVLATIAQAMGVRDTGDGSLEEKLAVSVRDRRVLLVLDNFEQVVDAAPRLATLLASSPGLTLLVTSRTRLRISAERSFEVGPLSLPDSSRTATAESVLAAPSVALFTERARAVKPDFQVTDANASAVAQLAERLDGVPLALELAAAKIRVLTPVAMLERLGRLLPFLGGGPRDLPPRQQTLRGTIEWSTQMLGEDEKQLLWALGVFDGGFSLEAVEAVYRPGPQTDTLTVLGTLVDNSLVRQEDRGSRSRFSLLVTVREFAREQLESTDRLPEVSELHAAYFVRLGQEAERLLEGPTQREWMSRLADDNANLRSTVLYLLSTGDVERAARFCWTLYVYWWVGGRLGEVRGWMVRVLETEPPVTGFTRAAALYFTRAIGFWQDPADEIIPGLIESAELFRAEGVTSGEALALVSVALARLASPTPDVQGAEDALETSLGLFRDKNDAWGQAMVLVTLGRTALLSRKVHAALNRFRESLALAEEQNDELSETIALHHLGVALALEGQIDEARSAFESSLAKSARLHHDDGIAYGLEGLIVPAVSSGDIERAGILAGAAQNLREETGLYNAPTFAFYQPWIDGILAGDGAAVFEAGRTQGRSLSAAQAVSYAIPGPVTAPTDTRADG